MNRLRTPVTALALGTTVIAGGALVTAASANAAPLEAVASAVSDTSTLSGQAFLSLDGATSSTSTASTAATGGVRATGMRQWWRGLSDTERTCLQDAGLTRPVGPLNDAERATLRDQVAAAAKTCGVELPHAKAREFWNSLSDTQKECLKDANVTRPVGRLNAEQRAAVRADLTAAAQSCGVTVPSAPAVAGS